MPNANVTPELSSIIKEMRQLTGTNAKDLADHIKKSAGFLSNVENGKATSIDLDVLFKIFNYFHKKNKDVDIQIDNFIENCMEVTYSLEEIEQRKNFTLFDKQFRNITIPPGYIDFIKQELQDKKISVDEVMEEINRNRDIDNPDGYEKNMLILNYQNSGGSETIVFELPSNFLDDILNGQIKKTNYVNLQGLLYALFILEGLSPLAAVEASHKELYRHKIYTLSERNKIMKDLEIKKLIGDNQSKSELPESVIEYQKYVTRILKVLSITRDFDNDYLNSKLNAFSENLETAESRSLMLGLIGLPLFKLKDVPEDKQKEAQKELFRHTKDLLNEILNKYKPEEQTIEIEKFD